jgi:hypothetical protein
MSSLYLDDPLINRPRHIEVGLRTAQQRAGLRGRAGTLVGARALGHD